ncbi:serine/threonine protein kinase HT1, putative [Entamoeba invadens IP1]|uniref:Serine/threonine protein kinase HT1, putative n=1 Tax=Entamoeba invadens IP1 TaxID=370355 RepID=A0A0A1UB53_ENTIV|nr:serine/threonine protein kinase HT1, putative [Entamoeba invadens IP1]ELP92416.1 serine/threonine protein kinase HT1, putative [Entamoeba invadens IP1]|eukprot:XP_004259187.1 serine/threonine protein kinase HT1, putative [Entamoeba invadens IP1]
MTIPKGKAIEFEMFLTPQCSCRIDDVVILFSLNMKKGITSEIPLKISAVTELSTKIDPDELIEEKKLGEGSFGVVYKGFYRENVVAIKKMKSLQINNAKLMEEFSNEVSMLGKFRCDYIVHFYGAVFIPNKVCMVTEFAKFGSLNDLITHKNKEENNMNKRVKFMLDASKGILYLHENGILHRDIKPDNILIFSLDLNEKVNAKLTDFGSSRNINMLMTNMTFTKGIGTPKFMSPEVLKKEKYKKSSDIYSFAITMYECFIWGESYPKTQFKYPWEVADFVSAGKRMKIKRSIPDELINLIENCWTQNPEERFSIDKVLDELGNCFVKF